jgi:nicotinate-nucleotide--dimethylbenzimidazole phosphoribosyltransferase
MQQIMPLDRSKQSLIQHKIDTKTKPLGALGTLENLALQISLIQNTESPTLNQPHLVVFAADHGVALHGVSAYPQEVTWQMVMNFLLGGAAINVFSRQHQLQLLVVDAGVNFDFPPNEKLINAKIAKGTAPFHLQAAMTSTQVQQAMEEGAKIVKKIHEKGCNIIGFGEMGIGNTTSAAMLMSFFMQMPVVDCIGKGTGIDNKGLAAKLKVMLNAYQLHKDLAGKEPINILAAVGGFEIAMMTGAMLQAAALQMTILVDGFIATASFLVAAAMQPAIKEYAIACHISEEQGHQKMLNFLAMNPLLAINMRLGEGTGVGVAYPLIQSAVNFMNEMASFESAGVANKA